MSRTFAEFFAGIGLVRLGLERSGWSCSFANDFDPNKFEMYRGHFRDASHAFSLCDINSLRPEDIPDVDLATASFPCTDLSLAGARAGLSGRHSSAFWSFTSLLERMGRRSPQFVLLENVPGFLTSHRGRDFYEALIALNRLGYGVDTFLLDASQFVPQSRQRLFVVGSKSSPTREVGTESKLRPPKLAKLMSSLKDVRWTLRDLPEPPKAGAVLSDVIEVLPESSKEWWSFERSNYLLNQMSSRHRATAEGMIHNDHESVGTIFRRVRNGRSMAELRTDGLAGCLRTPKGGSARQILFVAGCGSFRVRLLSARECARLMGADDFEIQVPLSKALFGFGDAVCASAIDWIATHYLNPCLDEAIGSTV